MLNIRTCKSNPQNMYFIIQQKEDKALETKTPYISHRSHPSGKGIYFLTGYLYVLLMVYGISLNMIGPMMSGIIDQYQLRVSQGGLIMTYQSIGGLLAILLGGTLGDLLSKS